MSIPTIFYQSWDEDLPKVVFLKNKKFIPDGFIYKRFSLDDIRNYLLEKWPHTLFLYDNYRLPQHKVDLWRYCILYDTGGIYMDVDCILMNSIQPLLSSDLFFVSNTRGDANIFNGFLGTYPNNPIYLSIIDYLLSYGPVVKRYYFNCEQLYKIITKKCSIEKTKYEYVVDSKKMYILWDRQHGDYRFYPYFKDVAILVETNPYYPYKKKIISTSNASTISNIIPHKELYPSGNLNGTDLSEH